MNSCIHYPKGCPFCNGYSSINEVEIMTYAEIVDRIGDFADFHVQALTEDGKVRMIEMSRNLSRSLLQMGMDPEILVTIFLSMGVEFLRQTPEYKATKGKTAEQITKEFPPCPSKDHIN